MMELKHIIEAARKFTDWEEGMAVYNAIRSKWPGRGEDVCSLLCYAAGVAEGKHQERQRRRKRFDAPREYMLTVKGSALAPTICDGDRVTIRKMDCSPDLQRWPFVVADLDGEAVLGQLIVNPDGSYQLEVRNEGGGGRLRTIAPEAVLGAVVALSRSIATRNMQRT